MPAGLELAVRLGGLRQRVAAVDDRLDPAGLDERPDVLAHGGDDRGLLVGRPGPQRGRDDGGALAQQLPEVELGLGAALQADDDQPSVDGERLDVAGEVLRAHVVEDDVGPGAAGGRAQLLDEVLLAVVDEDLGAELAAGLELVGGACRDGDPGADLAGQLDRHRADAGGAAVDQEASVPEGGSPS